MTGILNTLRKLLFTNLAAERMLISATAGKNAPSIIKKLIAPNSVYPKNSVRKVKRFGINFELDLNDYPAWLIYFNSDADNTFNVLSFLGNAKTIFDVGGNMGQTALAISQKVSHDATIYSFEPYPATYQKFKNNLLLNPLIKNIIAENIALGETESELLMFQDCATNSGGFRIVYDKEKNNSGVVKTQSTSIDSYVKNNNISKIDFIKIDVEGFEMTVLKGAKNTLLNHRPKLFIELNDSNLNKQNASSKALITFLVSMGYKISNAASGAIYTEQSSYPEHCDIFCESL